jgi:hypothetical protein
MLAIEAIPCNSTRTSVATHKSLKIKNLPSFAAFVAAQTLDSLHESTVVDATH